MDRSFQLDQPVGMEKTKLLELENRWPEYLVNQEFQVRRDFRVRPVFLNQPELDWSVALGRRLDLLVFLENQEFQASRDFPENLGYQNWFRSESVSVKKKQSVLEIQGQQAFLVIQDLLVHQNLLVLEFPYPWVEVWLKSPVVAVKEPDFLKKSQDLALQSSFQIHPNPTKSSKP
jgi:hypothetical protein